MLVPPSESYFSVSVNENKTWEKPVTQAFSPCTCLKSGKAGCTVLYCVTEESKDNLAADIHWHPRFHNVYLKYISYIFIIFRFDMSELFMECEEEELEPWQKHILEVSLIDDDDDDDDPIFVGELGKYILSLINQLLFLQKFLPNVAC